MVRSATSTLKNQNLKVASPTKRLGADPELRRAVGQKISQAKKGKPTGRKGQTNGRKGISHSAEHVEKIRLALNTPESKQKRSEAVKKALQDPQWKAEQSARIKGVWAIRKAQKEAA